MRNERRPLDRPIIAERRGNGTERLGVARAIPEAAALATSLPNAHLC
jgi:hypothetical protein